MGHPRNRAERRFHRNRVIANRIREYRSCLDYNLTHGRCAKKSPYDCGNSCCFVCHGDKFDKRLKHKRRNDWKKEVHDV